MLNQRNNDPAACTRRTFIKTSTVAVAGLAMANRNFASPKTETLAVSGGAKAVKVPAQRQAALSHWPRYDEKETKAVSSLLDSNKYYEELPLFEKEWKDYVGVPHVKLHHNGTSALSSMYFALSLDVPPGSEILVPSLTFFATIMPMRIVGLVPVFVDCDPRTANFDVEHAAKVITPKTVAMVPVHWQGLPCDMDRLAAFAKEKGIMLCEDCAHAQGATMHGKQLGTFGTMAITSFQASKPLPAIEGGAGMYQTRTHYERAAAFGHYEDPAKFPADSPYRVYDNTGFGQKYRMHPFAAALGRSQLKKLDQVNAGVTRRVRQLNDRLKQLPGLREPVCPPDARRIYYNHNTWFIDPEKAGFTRDQLCKAFRAEGGRITEGRYPQQHQHKVYAEAKWWHHAPTVPAKLAGSDKINETRFYLPLMYEDQPELIEQSAQAFEKIWAHKDEVAKL